MRIRLTNNFDYWRQGCSSLTYRELSDDSFPIDKRQYLHESPLLQNPYLSHGVSSALVEYEIKRRSPILVNVRDIAIISLSLPMKNGEFEEHYYFCNERGEWLTENPFLSQFQHWFINSRPVSAVYGDYYVTPRFPINDYLLDSQYSDFVFLGGRMNWTHWNIDCLAPLLLSTPSDTDVFLTSQLRSWQLDGLDFFGYSNNPRIQISHGNGFSRLPVQLLNFIWNFDQIDRFSYLRSQFAKHFDVKTDQTKYALLSPRIDDVTPLRVKRVHNSDELHSCLLKNNATLIQPSSLSYSQKLSIYGNSHTILTLPGSDSINALLFGCSATKIIQMIPWPNDLMLLNKYSLIVAYRQLAFQTSLNILPYFGTPVSSQVNGFDEQYYYSVADLQRLF